MRPSPAQKHVTQKIHPPFPQKDASYCCVPDICLKLFCSFHLAVFITCKNSMCIVELAIKCSCNPLDNIGCDRLSTSNQKLNKPWHFFGLSKLHSLWFRCQTISKSFDLLSTFQENPAVLKTVTFFFSFFMMLRTKVQSI